MFYFFKQCLVSEWNMTFDLAVVERVRYSLFKVAEKPEKIDSPADAEPEHRYYGQAQRNRK